MLTNDQSFKLFIVNKIFGNSFNTYCDKFQTICDRLNVSYLEIDYGHINAKCTLDDIYICMLSALLETIDSTIPLFISHYRVIDKNNMEVSVANRDCYDLAVQWVKDFSQKIDLNINITTEYK